jgi:hypothetical protein
MKTILTLDLWKFKTVSSLLTRGSLVDSGIQNCDSPGLADTGEM